MHNQHLTDLWGPALCSTKKDRHCDVENMFAAATYTKTQEEVNREAQVYFQQCLQNISRVLRQSDSDMGPHPHAELQSVKVLLSEPDQTVRFSMKLEVQIRGTSGNDKHYYKCTKHRPGPEHCFLRFFDCQPTKVPYSTVCSCHGNIWRQQTRHLKAQLRLAEARSKFTWLTSTLQDDSGECTEADKHLHHFDFQAMFEYIQREIRKRWHDDQILPSGLNFAPGMHASLQFPPPKILGTGDTGNPSFLAGSVHTCIEGNGTFFAVGAEKRGIRQCQSRLNFSTFRSKEDLTYDFRKLGAEAAEQGTSSLVFSWADGSQVALRLFVGSVTVEARLTELAENNATSFLLSVTCGKCTCDGGTCPASQIPQWISFLKADVPRPIWRLIRRWTRQPQPTQDPAVNATTQPGGAQGSLFWMLADNNTQTVSIGRGSVLRKDEILSLQIKDGRGLAAVAHQFGLSKKATWKVSSGMPMRLCSPSIPASLSADGHGTIRLSTSLLEGLFWARSQQLMAYASNTSRNVLDAALRNDLQFGKVQFTVDTDTVSSSGQSSLLWLTVAGAHVSTSCPSRQEPLLAASVQHVHSAAAAQGCQEPDGGLAVSVAAQTGEHAPRVSGFHLRNPRVPVAESVPNFLLTGIIQAMNKRLEHITLHIPRELAQFIPCHMMEGQCRNMQVYMLSKEQDAGGYLEFVEAEAAAAETFIAEQPKLPSHEHYIEDAISFIKWIVYLFFKYIAWLPWLLNLGLCVWTSSWEWAVSSFALLILCLAWHQSGPLAGFTESAFSDFGISAPTDVIERMQWFTNCATAVTYVYAILPLFIAALRQTQLRPAVAWAARKAEVPQPLTKLFEASTEDTVLGHILFSFLVSVSQLAFIIVIPLRVNLGKQVALHVASHSANWYPGTAVDIVKEVFGKSDVDIHTATATFVSSSFTALYVSHLGLYLIFFLLALAPGVFIGALVFTTMHWKERRVRGVVDMSTSFILMMELIPSAAILGAFTIAYQILGGNSTWWLAYGIIGVCRPLLSVPFFRMLLRQEQEQKPMGTILSLAAGYIVLSLVGATLLWSRFHKALEGLSSSTALHTPFSGLSMFFVGSQFLTLGWVIAVSMYSILQDIVWNSSKSLRNVERSLEDAADELINVRLRPVAAHLLAIKSLLSPACLKRLWQLSFPWIIWILEMDALVSLFYHAMKIVWLGLGVELSRDAAHVKGLLGSQGSDRCCCFRAWFRLCYSTACR